MQRMLDAGVSTRRGVMNAHLEASYASAPPRRLPHSEEAQQRGVILPLMPDMDRSRRCGASCEALCANFFSTAGGPTRGRR